MTAYAFWNNKGGVGKSFICFISACEYAHRYPDKDIYVIDLCPQENVSETLLGGYLKGSKYIRKLIKKPHRATIGGYLDSRLNSPFKDVEPVDSFICNPSKYNSMIPANLSLICGDNLLEVQSEAIRQVSQLIMPKDSWMHVISWIRDLTKLLSKMSGDRAAVFFIDCNPSFAIFTQLAIVAADHIIIPFTADDSSRRAVENLIMLLYGIGDPAMSSYAKITFAQKAKDEKVEVPKIHTFVSNRMTKYKGSPSRAFNAIINAMKTTIDSIHDKNREIFSHPGEKPSKSFILVPDEHGACVLATTKGTPLHMLRPGPHKLIDERVQINKGPLDDYKSKLNTLVDRL